MFIKPSSNWVMKVGNIASDTFGVDMVRLLDEH